MASPGPSPTDIQSHLYASFLQASTFDVSLRVSGTWKAVYKLHRVVLIQSGFFKSLFTSGFAESSIKRAGATDEIEVVFDDYNITRPAFEICIARLYGGGPPLHVSPNIVPTRDYPLTPPFSGRIEVESVPEGHQPSSPHFLLSLLATSIFLSIPSVASQALSLILKTIGPKTIMCYLNFALGQPIQQDERDVQPAVGLENVAVLERDADEVSIASMKTAVRRITPAARLVTQPEELQETPSNESVDSDDYDIIDEQPSHHYGGISDKIGEACACWLARWATDMLRYEELEHSDDENERTGGKPRSSSFSSLFDTPGVRSSGDSKPVVDGYRTRTIFGRGGLKPEWVAALVSSDFLFVANERERYNFACTVVELRRRQGISQEEETIWEDMFEHGIFYANMSFDDMLAISQDISPTTKRNFVPLSVLQNAQWTQSYLRHQIMSRPGVNAASSAASIVSNVQRDKELGVTVTTADLLSKISNSAPAESVAAEKLKTYFPVFGDVSLRVGEHISSSNSSPPSMDQLFGHCHTLNTSSGQPVQQKAKYDKSAIGSVMKGQRGFFGLANPRYNPPACVEADSPGKARWSPFPPYRFSVEFWDVDLLKEKSRLYSHTIWYAGSLFNVYVQVVRKKGQTQLGIYLQRQSHVDPIPAPSTPFSGVIGSPKISGPASQSDRHLERHPSLPSPRPSPSVLHYSPSIHPLARSTTALVQPTTQARPASPPSPPGSPQSLSSSPPSLIAPSTSQPYSPSQPYRDPRAAVSAYFSITSASTTGSSQTRFSSTPDVFSVSQSWGWKSSSLRGGEEMELGVQGVSPSSNRGREVSLRATVVLGLV